MEKDKTPMEVFIESMKEADLEAVTRRLHEQATATPATERDNRTEMEAFLDECKKAALADFDRQLYDQLTAIKDKPLAEKKQVLLRLIKGGKEIAETSGGRSGAS